MPDLSDIEIENLLAMPENDVTRKVLQGIKEQYRAYIALKNIITTCPLMLALKEDIKILRDRNEPVLILGETGTGKSLIAQALHSNRIGKFIRVNCSGLPDELIESELFGHTKGAFTGAVSDRVGKFLAARNGTIFLDEIGDMPINMQCKLLIALQEKVIIPLGSNDEIPINCRVVSATNKVDITKHIREDLYYRLSTFTLTTVPLRERPNDIELMLNTMYDKGKLIPVELCNKIKQLPLKGNVRELEAIVLNYIVRGKLNI